MVDWVTVAGWVGFLLLVLLVMLRPGTKARLESLWLRFRGAWSWVAGMLRRVADWFRS